MSHSDPATAAPRHALERWTRRAYDAIRALPSLPFLLGIALGFAGCVLAGRIVSERPMFENFLRFFAPIQPQRFFYPTASQLAAHVRHTVPPGKIPVIVGGASYFRGTGQNPGELWSLELQRVLGERYVVINFATDQAPLTAFAAVAFAAVAREFPDALYVANASPVSGAPWDGGDDYRYIFWDAYYKGLLPASIARASHIRELANSQRRDPLTLETHLGKWTDALAYACDLWTYIGYKHVFTVWSNPHAHDPFRARRHGREGDDPTLAQQQLNVRNDRAYVEHSENHARNMSRASFAFSADGQCRPDPAAWDGLAQEWRDMFPEELRSRCFVVFLRGNPHFMQTLTADERRRTELQFELGQQNLERAGYRVVQLQPSKFTADDFLDGGHLMASGGRKVAHAVAARIAEVLGDREIAQRGPSPPGALELQFSPPADRRPRREPLIALALPGTPRAELLFIEYLDSERVRLGYSRGEPDDTVYSPEIALTTGRIHRLRTSLPGLYPAAPIPEAGLSAAQLAWLKSWLLVRLDDRAFWEVPLVPATTPSAPGELRLGADFAANGAGARFTGMLHSSARQPSPPSLPPRDRVGGAKLRLTLTPAMIGRSLPLVSTGATGRGDMLFMRVDAGGKVTFNYDHWAAPSVASSQIPLAFGVAHTIEFRVPALAGDEAARELVVSVNGNTIWKHDVPFFPPDAQNVFFGQNPIGATTAEPRLEGAVFERVLLPSWEG